MSDSDGIHQPTPGRLAAIAFGFVICIALIGFAWTSVETARTKREIAYQTAQQRCAGARDTDCQELATAIRAAVAAEDAATFAAQQLWINILGLIGLGGTVWFAASAWYEAKRSADADNAALAETRAAAENARKDAAAQAERFNTQLTVAQESNRLVQASLTAEHRPWLKLASITHGDLNWSEPEARIVFRAKFENYGRSPAADVEYDLRTMIGMEDPHVLRVEMTNNVRNAGYLIFPRDDMEFALNIPISAAQIEEAREAHRKNFGLEDDYEIRHFMVRVVGVLKYWGNAPEPYHLSFIFSLLERPHSALRPGVSLKQEQLLLERTGWRDIIAT